MLIHVNFYLELHLSFVCKKSNNMTLVIMPLIGIGKPSSVLCRLNYTCVYKCFPDKPYFDL